MQTCLFTVCMVCITHQYTIHFYYYVKNFNKYLTGHNQLGGIEMDLAIMTHFAPQIMAKTGIDLSKEKHNSFQVLLVLRAIKVAKERLSNQPEVC